MSTAWQFREWAVRVLGVFVAVGLVVVAGLMVPRQPIVSMAIAGGALALGLTSLDPIAIPTVAVPAMLVIERVGGAGVNLSISDVALAVAFVPAVLLCHRPVSREFATIVGLNGLYQFATLLTVVVNPYLANLVEWFHAWLLVSGALFVGWAVGRGGRGPLAIKLLLAASVVIGIGTLATALPEYARGHFGPVYPTWPFAMHKNFAGPMLALAAVLVYLRPTWFGWRTHHSHWLLALFLVTAAITQSRQAMLGLAVVFFLVVVRRRVDRRRSRMVLIVVATVLGTVGVMVQDQLQSGNRFNSTLQRLNWFSEAIEVWLTDPWVGVGLRWWYTDRFDTLFQPPNAELEVLTSAGVIGLIAFLAMFGGSMLVLRRMDPAYGLLPLMVLVCRLAQAQFDLFWVAVSGSVPWLITGLALGAHALARSEQERARRLANVRARP
ncbi:MAG: O-antigen ligase family protein [Actinomycetales bacterium]|nr:O-antigen ligase family protein [Candidatus Phosphoribacter baldrii]